MVNCDRAGFFSILKENSHIFFHFWCSRGFAVLFSYSLSLSWFVNCELYDTNFIRERKIIKTLSVVGSPFYDFLDYYYYYYSEGDLIETDFHKWRSAQGCLVTTFYYALSTVLLLELNLNVIIFFFALSLAVFMIIMMMMINWQLTS